MWVALLPVHFTAQLGSKVQTPYRGPIIGNAGVSEATVAHVMRRQRRFARLGQMCQIAS
jgi:hypothetical protein